MKKRALSLSALAVMCIVLLVGCSAGTSSSRQFKDFAEFRETFGDTISYPTHLPAGFDYTKGEGTFGGGASYINKGSLFAPPDSSRNNLAVAAVGCTKEAEEKEDWVLLGVSMQVYTAAEYYEGYGKAIDDYIAETQKGEVTDIAHQGHDIVLREYYDTENLKDPNKESNLPYARCFLDYTFILGDQPYTFNYFIEVYTANVDAVMQEIRETTLAEAVLSYKSLAPYGA